MESGDGWDIRGKREWGQKYFEVKISPTFYCIENIFLGQDSKYLEGTIL